MQNIKHTLLYGFAIFAMFFGSGNLVFPLQIGLNSSADWLIGFFGLFLTGIALPFLGLFVIKLHQGCYNNFFAEAGSLAQWILPFFTLSLLGSFGIVPRCITVAYGGLNHIFPGLALGVFSFIFCALCYLACLKDHLMIHIVGKWITPILLLLLMFLIIFGISQAPDISTQPAGDAIFTNGFLVGYQTMDLFAAFFFSALVFKQIQNKMPKETTHRQIIQKALGPSLLGAGLLALIYLGFVYLGAHYQSLIIHTAPEFMLPTIAQALLGKKAAVLIGVIILFSCLTTAVALNNIYARYLCTLMKVKETRFAWVLLATTMTSFAISLLDFNGIARFLAPILEVTYPSLILLTFLSVFVREYKMVKITLFYLLLALMCMQKYIWI